MKKIYEIFEQEDKYRDDVRKVAAEEDFSLYLAETYEILTQEQMEELERLVDDSRKKMVSGKIGQKFSMITTKRFSLD
ncbi:MAG: hypothetical protein LUF92_02505 [Clostridiales bacterium]|nr:hypothetical protein [Clostridiales bacterium]